MNKAELDSAIRVSVLSAVTEYIEKQMNTDALPVSASAVAIPVVDAEGNEKFVTITVAVPRGTRNEDGGYDAYDGYAAAEEYRAEQEERAAKKAAAAAKKAAAQAKRERKQAEKAVPPEE